jgi:hypothetical protein
MDMKTGSIFAVTTIHDRHGRRVGSYLVDRTKDSLERDKKHEQSRRESSDKDQAVVFHHSEDGPGTPVAGGPSSTDTSEPSALDLTV